jgi:hypothetical protein
MRTLGGIAGRGMTEVSALPAATPPGSRRIVVPSDSDRPGDLLGINLTDGAESDKISKS